MARRAKTVIGKGEREQTRLMQQGLESGVAARQRATDALTRQQEVGFQQGMQIARLGAEVGQRFAEKEQRGEIAGAQLEQRGKEATGQQMLQQRGQEFQEGKEGMERTPGGDVPPLIQDERTRRLEAEMGKGTAGEQPGAAPMGETSPRTPEEVQRLQAQGAKPVELGGAGAAQPGMQGPPQEPGGKLRLSEIGERRETRADFEADTRRIAAQGRITARQNKYSQAEIAGNKEAQKIIRDAMDVELEQQSDLLTRIMNNKPSATDFTTLTKWAKDARMEDSPGGADLMEILKQGSKSGFGPVDPAQRTRLQAFIKSHMDKSGMMYAATIGQLPDTIDHAGQIMGQYRAAQEEITTWMQQLGPRFQNYNGINSWAEKIRYQNRWAAVQVLKGKASIGSGGDGGGGVARGMAPGGAPAEQPGAAGGGFGIGGQQFGGAQEQQQPQPQQDLRQQVPQMPPVQRPGGPAPVTKPIVPGFGQKR